MTVEVEEPSSDPSVIPLGPGHPEGDRLLWLEFAVVALRRDFNGLLTSVTETRRSLDKLTTRVTFMTGLMLGVMGILKMLPDSSLEAIRHFLAGP